MAVKLPNSVYVHLMKTGGWTIRDGLKRLGLYRGEIGRGHDPASLLSFPPGTRPFTFVFIRHPLAWYRSYWAFRMQAAWRVHPNQEITGWQTFGSVLDHECRSDDFKKWMENVLLYVPEGFLSRIYRIYTEQTNFVGKAENFSDDFCQALKLAGEKFSARDVRLLPRRNATNLQFVQQARFSSKLAEKVLTSETYIVQRWSYHNTPKGLIPIKAWKGYKFDGEIQSHRQKLDRLCHAKMIYPRGLYSGRGIVICGGGRKYFPCAWVCVRMLRYLKCSLPIQIWHLGKKEMSGEMRLLIEPYGVEVVDAFRIREKHPARILNGWELKPYSIIHSHFNDVMLLDADVVPVVNPDFLFETPEYERSGAIFWPDFGRLAVQRSIWNACGVRYRDEPEIESGQIVLNKKRCWKALQVTMHLNEHSDFYYKHMYGDKETFHMAFRRVRKAYDMPMKPIVPLKGTMCQHDFDGNRIFQHRNRDKWRLDGANESVPDFLFENECRIFLDELKAKWSGIA